MAAQITEDGHGGHDVEDTAFAPRADASEAQRPQPNSADFSGIWLSRYEYFSSGRQAVFANLHYVVILQQGWHLTVRSLPGSNPSALSLELDVDGGVATGIWTEQTDPNGFYRGARYHGAIQLLIEPTGRRLAGKWLGYGRSSDVNSGPWEFILQNPSTSKPTVEVFNRPPEADDY